MICVWDALFEVCSSEPSRFEPSRFEPSRFEPSRFEPSPEGMEPTRMEKTTNATTPLITQRASLRKVSPSLTRCAFSHGAAAYSPKFVVKEFCELRLLGILGSSQ